MSGQSAMAVAPRIGSMAPTREELLGMSAVEAQAELERIGGYLRKWARGKEDPLMEGIFNFDYFMERSAEPLPDLAIKHHTLVADKIHTWMEAKIIEPEKAALWQSRLPQQVAAQKQTEKPALPPPDTTVIDLCADVIDLVSSDDDDEVVRSTVGREQCGRERA